MALTKDQLIQDIAEAIDAQKTTVRSALDQLAEIVKDALENDGEITLPGIGKLKVSERPARTGRNPQTGKAIEIAAKRVAKFVPAKALTDALVDGDAAAVGSYSARMAGVVFPGETLHLSAWKTDAGYLGTLTVPSRDNAVALSGVEFSPR